MKNLFVSTLLLLIIVGCKEDEPVPSVSELLPGKWELVSIQDADESDKFPPMHPMTLAIIIRDSSALSEGEPFISNGEFRFYNSDLYGYTAPENYNSPKIWQWKWNEFEKSMTDMTDTWEFPINIYIISVSENSLILQADGFPYWPKLYYRKI